MNKRLIGTKLGAARTCAKSGKTRVKDIKTTAFFYVQLKVGSHFDLSPEKRDKGSSF